MATAREVSDRYTELINAHDARGDRCPVRGRRSVHRACRRVSRAGRGDLLLGALLRGLPGHEGQDTFKAEAGDTAINEWTVSGTNTGPMETPEGTIPATGKRVSVSGSDALTVRDGLIRSQRAYYDQLAFMTQLGLVPEGAASV